MNSPDNRYRLILIVTVISLSIAVIIVILFSGTTPSQEIIQDDNEIPGIVPVDNLIKKDEYNTRIERVLWFDDQNLTYFFKDYQSSERPGPDNYSIIQNPPVTGVRPAMIRVLSWDGTTERIIKTKYIEDTERVTQILNRYALKTSNATHAPVEPTETIMPATPKTPSPGSITPLAGTVCRNPDGSYTANFGYISSNDEKVVLEIGDGNKFTPGEKARGQPVLFEPGVHHEVFSISYPADATNQIWTLMGIQVSGGVVPELNTTISADPMSGYAPLEVRFDSKESGGTKDNPLTSECDLDDGTKIQDKKSFTYRYENPGIYRIRYTVSNRCNLVADEVTVRVYRPSFTWHKASETRNSVFFNDTSEGDPSVWFWDFSDGYTSWDKNPEHTFPREGTYNVGLIVSGKNGRGMVTGSVIV